MVILEHLKFISVAGNAGGSEVAQHSQDHQTVAGSGGGSVDQQVNSVETNGKGL